MAQLATGQSAKLVNRKVPIAQIIRVLTPSQDPRVPGLHYCRHCAPDAEGKFRGLSDGLLVMSANGVSLDANSIAFPIINEPNYAFITKGREDFEDMEDAAGHGFKVDFADNEHARLTQVTGYTGKHPTAAQLQAAWASENSEYSMERVTDPEIGPLWLRHSANVDPLSHVKTPLPDYKLIPMADADGRPNINYFKYFLPDMASAGITEVDIVVNGDSELAKKGSVIPAGITLDDEHLYIDSDKGASTAAGSDSADGGVGDSSGDGSSTVSTHDRGVSGKR